MVDRATVLVHNDGRHDFLTTVLLTSWIYDEPGQSRDKATAFFRAIRSSLEAPEPTWPFPYGGPWEVALIDASEWWGVAVWGVMPDKYDVLDELTTWLAACGARDQSFVEHEIHHVPSTGRWMDALALRSPARVVDVFGGTAEHSDARRIGIPLGRA